MLAVGMVDPMIGNIIQDILLGLVTGCSLIVIVLLIALVVNAGIWLCEGIWNYTPKYSKVQFVLWTVLAVIIFWIIGWSISSNIW